MLIFRFFFGSEDIPFVELLLTDFSELTGGHEIFHFFIMAGHISTITMDTMY